MSNLVPFAPGSLTASFEGKSKTWSLHPQYYRTLLLHGVWRPNAETRQVPDGEEIVSYDSNCGGGNVRAGSTYGLPFGQVCVRLGNDYSGPNLQSQGYLLVQRNTRPSPDVWAREYPYPIKGPKLKTQYRSQFELFEESFQKTAAYPDDSRFFNTEWTDYGHSFTILSSQWNPTLLCDPINQITCGDIDSGWCCIDFLDVQNKLTEIDRKLEASIKLKQEIILSIKGGSE